MKKQTVTALSGGILFLAGVGLALATRPAALAEGAGALAQAPFALGAILALGGLLLSAAALFVRTQPVSVRTLAMAALFAALSYIGFAYLRIDIPVGGSSTAFHLGNVFCVLAALLLGGFWGGISGAVGLTLADLTSGYVTSAPKTFLLKLCIGLITGLVAHRVFHLSRDRTRKVPLWGATALSALAGMGFNLVADPVVGYFYKMYVLGIPQDAAKLLASLSAVTTAVNALLAVLTATLAYLALRPALTRTNLLPRL